MEQFEKVCKGLECCILRDPDDHRRCGECPYNPHAISNEPCANGLKFNAIALIRQQQERIAELEAAQTARVMSLEDVDTAEACMEPVFVEMLDENGKPGETPDIFSWRFVKHIMPLTDGKIYVLNNIGFSSALYEETYNITWRCWTQRPTEAERKAVKWDG